MSFALITGASSGIGYEFAKIFAQNKISIILIARRLERLKQISEKLENQYAVQTKIIVKDLSQTSAALDIYNVLQKEKISVDYLVNNAGFIVYGPFSNTKWENEFKMMNLHIITSAYFIKLFLPHMLKNKSGKILNIASTGAFTPAPYNAVYCATKNFVLSLSEAVRTEIENSGVTITTLCPGGIKTGFNNKAGVPDKNSFFFKKSDPEVIARVGFKYMMKGKSVVIPGIFNKIQVNISRILPGILTLKMLKVMMADFKDL